MKLFLGLALAATVLGSTQLRADSPLLPVVTEVEAREMFAHRLINAEVTPGSEAGTLDIEYSVQFSNSCVASANSIHPTLTRTSVYNDKGKSQNHILFVAAQGPVKKIFCPAVYRPVVQTQKVTLKNLQSRERYEVQVLGLTTKSEAYKTFDVFVK